MQAASNSNIQATNERGSRRARAPSMVSGNSSAVSTTRNSEMPSTPSDQWMPRSCGPDVVGDHLVAAVAGLELGRRSRRPRPG